MNIIYFSNYTRHRIIMSTSMHLFQFFDCMSTISNNVVNIKVKNVYYIYLYVWICNMFIKNWDPLWVWCSSLIGSVEKLYFNDKSWTIMCLLQRMPAKDDRRFAWIEVWTFLAQSYCHSKWQCCQTRRISGW